MSRTVLKCVGMVVFMSVFLAASLAGVKLAIGAVAFFSTGDPDGKIATLSRPGSAGKLETESADDFILNAQTSITGAAFTGLLTGGTSAADVQSVRVEIYRVFPLDSNDPPSGNVPTRVNSPSDVELTDRDSATNDLNFSVSTLNGTFTVLNSVVNGINPLPNQFTQGEGPVTGVEVQVAVDFTTPFLLSAGHYFFVPQVGMSLAGDFLWLSAPRPIVAPGTPFAPDLQTWIRNENLAPDWLRVGTDITGQGPFNASFSLNGSAVPEPCSVILLGSGLACLLALKRRRR